MTETKKQMVKMMIAAQLSRGGVHTAGSLAWGAMITEQSDTYPKTRALIKEMINEGHLIGSTSEGYKRLQTGKEVQLYLNSLLKRQMGISRRIQAVYDAAQTRGIL